MRSHKKTSPDNPHPSIQRDPIVEQRVGVHRRTLRRWEARGLFPRRVVIGPNAVGYFTHEVDEWIASRERRSSR
jgi:predicted DNA-binding transcriptional regulator AlpA